MNTAQTTVSEGRSIYQTVVEAIADADDSDPTELYPPLNEVVDPDALDALFARDSALGKVVFNYNSYEVSVFPDGYVSVEDHGT